VNPAILSHLTTIRDCRNDLLRLAEADLHRADKLRNINKEYMSDAEYDTYVAAVLTAEIDLQYAEIALIQAQSSDAAPGQAPIQTINR